MPVRMSPVPPVPMAGVPVGLIQTRPSGNAISVRWPFSTSVTSRVAWRRRAPCPRGPSALRRWILPVSRAISPGCGVSTRMRSRRPGRLARSGRRHPAPSAVRTPRRGVHQRRRSPAARPSPGPIAITVLPSASGFQVGGDGDRAVRRLFAAARSSTPARARRSAESRSRPRPPSPAPRPRAARPGPPWPARPVLPREPRHHQHVAEGALVPAARPRRQQFAEHRRLDQRQPTHPSYSDSAGCRWRPPCSSPTWSQFGGSTCAGLGAVNVTVQSARANSPTGSPRIAGHAGGNIHRHHLRQRKALVDLADALQHRARGGAADARAQQRVDHQRGAAGLRRDLARSTGQPHAWSMR